MRLDWAKGASVSGAFFFCPKINLKIKSKLFAFEFENLFFYETIERKQNANIMKNLVDFTNSELYAINHGLKSTKTDAGRRRLIAKKTAIVFFVAGLLECPTIGDLKNHGIKGHI
jgi:hypothetical protein